MIPDFLAHALAPDRWPTFALITARLAGLMLSAPLWSMAVLPGPLRGAITVVLAVMLLPVTPDAPLPDRLLDLPLPVVMELMVGIVIGLCAAVVVHGLSLAGEVISLQMGLTLGPVLAPTPDVQVSGIGQIKGWLAILVYLGIGGHLILLRGIADSLIVLPPGSAMSFAGGAAAGLDLAGVVFSSAVRAAAPVMVTLLLTNLALAILSRAVPQLNTMMVSLPITFAVGLLVLGISLPVVTSVIGVWMDGLPDRVATVISGFRPVP